jgi:hypothetical protein
MSDGRALPSQDKGPKGEDSVRDIGTMIKWIKRQPQLDSGQIIKTLKSSDITEWHQISTNEGHGFRKKDTRDFMNYSIVKFWRTFLLWPH